MIGSLDNMICNNIR